jgi:hypothetical protein
MVHNPLNFLMPGIGPAGLPLPVTEQSLPETAHHVGRAGAAEPQSATESRDPGSIEFDSWAAYLRHSVR